MNGERLEKTALELVSDGRGILAMDESNPTCGKRFASVGVENTAENRRAYRNLLVSAPGLAALVSGAILYDETIRQSDGDGRPFPEALGRRGILPGIKVDTGAKDLALHPGEKVTEGLDDLRDRLREYRELGARFAKWRALIAIGEGLPTPGCIEANAHAAARYAALSQEAGLVPIVEPEVLLDGDHSMGRCAEVTEATLRVVFRHLRDQRVLLEGMLLKASMVLPGKEATEPAKVDAVARATLRCLRVTVPPAVAGIVFLSGGQGDELATAHLNAINVASAGRASWPLSFSFSRALQRPALAIWRGLPSNGPAAQRALLHRARCNAAAARGRYSESLEKQLAA